MTYLVKLIDANLGGTQRAWSNRRKAESFARRMIIAGGYTRAYVELVTSGETLSAWQRGPDGHPVRMNA